MLEEGLNAQLIVSGDSARIGIGTIKSVGGDRLPLEETEISYYSGTDISKLR